MYGPTLPVTSEPFSSSRTEMVGGTENSFGLLKSSNFHHLVRKNQNQLKCTAWFLPITVRSTFQNLVGDFLKSTLHL